MQPSRSSWLYTSSASSSSLACACTRERFKQLHLDSLMDSGIPPQEPKVAQDRAVTLMHTFMSAE